MESDWVTFSPGQNLISSNIDTPPSNYILGQDSQMENEYMSGNNQMDNRMESNTPNTNPNEKPFLTEQDHDFLQQFDSKYSSDNTSAENHQQVQNHKLDHELNQNSNDRNGNHMPNHLNGDLNETWNDLQNIDFLNPNSDSNNHTPDVDMNINFESYIENDQSQSHINNHHHHSISNVEFEHSVNNTNQSAAFPPLNSSIVPPTPSSLELLSHTNTFFQSPVLLSQHKKKSHNSNHNINPNSNSNSNVNHNHTHNHSHSHSHSNVQHQQHVRPDVIFTPLVSPAVTPLESQFNMNKSGTPALQTFFSPLTSPALEAKKRLSPEEMSSISHNLPSVDKRRTSSTSSYKRKTPLNTPIMSATKNARIIKQSPIIKTRKSTTINSKNYEKLPESSIDYNKSNQSTPMLPPSSTIITKRPGSTSSLTEKDSPPTSTNQAPTSMMNFTLGKLQQQQQSQNNTISILPKSGGPPQQSPVLLSQNVIPTNYSNLVNVSFNMKNIYSNSSQSVELRDDSDSNTKKNSHKLAEKGRRNRMNIAIQELSSLIPQVLHDEVAIPSKATTVELGSKFIKILLDEIEALKKRNVSNNKEESISPLEFEK